MRCRPGCSRGIPILARGGQILRWDGVMKSAIPLNADSTEYLSVLSRQASVYPRRAAYLLVNDLPNYRHGSFVRISLLQRCHGQLFLEGLILRSVGGRIQ